MDIHAYLVHTEYDVTSYFRSALMEVEKTSENADSDSFGSHYSGAAFCLAQPIGWLFVIVISGQGTEDG